LKRVLEMSDVLIEVLDARDPLSCRTSSVEDYVNSFRPEVAIVLVLNKIDLAPPHSVDAWVRHLSASYPTIPFKSATGTRRGNSVMQAKERVSEASASQRKTHDCLGAQHLIQVLKEIGHGTAGFGGRAKMTVGVVGYPNVGKSSLVNSLIRAKSAETGDKPGVTRSLQELRLDKGIILLDTPGVVFDSHHTSSLSAIMRHSIAIEKIEDVEGLASQVMERCGQDTIARHYNISESGEGAGGGMLEQIAAKRGKVAPGGGLDTEAAARVLLQDLNKGRLSFHTMPPAPPAECLIGDAQVVESFGKAFELQDLEGEEGEE